MKFKRFLTYFFAVISVCVSLFSFTACNDSNSEGNGDNNESNDVIDENDTLDNKKFTEGLIFQIIEGKKEYSVYDLGTAKETNIVIPSEYNGLPVTAIAEKAFLSEYSINSIVLPDSITEIGNQAFSHCEGLTTISLPKNLTEIKYRVFCQCIKLESIDIPESVTKIGVEAFASCLSLKEILIPDKVTFIGSKAFSGCAVKKVTIGYGVNNIQPYAFENCYGLQNVLFKDTAFWRITGLGDYVKNLANSSLAAQYLKDDFAYAIWNKDS